MSMSPRERLLLIVLSAVVILFGGFKLLIEPGLKQMSDIKANLLVMNDKLITSKNNVVLANSIDENNKKLEEKILKQSVPFYHELLQEETHTWFNNYIKGSNIIPSNLSVPYPIAEQIQVSQAKEIPPLEYPIKDAADAILSNNFDKKADSKTDNKVAEDPAKKDDIPLDTVEKIGIIMLYTGTYDQTLKFLDSIFNSKRYARVTVATISSEDNINYDVIIETEFFGIKKYFKD